MDASKLSNLDLEILDAVFCSFDQGDYVFNLEHIERSPGCDKEENDNVWDRYKQMGDAVTRELARRKSNNNDLSNVTT